MGDNQSYTGAEGAGDALGRYAEMAFLVRQIMGEIEGATLVKVVAVANAGELSPVGLVDVMPLVNQLDGSNNAVPHGTVHDVPYFRLQGGTNAIICDPVVGDIGIAIIAGRDLSSVKANKAVANPGSRRRHSFSDGLYIGGYLNAAPVNYIRFTNGDVEIKPANTVTIIGDLHVTQTLTADMDVVGGGKSLKTHTHGGVTTGSAISGPPS